MAAPGQDRSFFAAKLAASSVARIVLFALAVVIAVSGGPGTAQTTKPPKHVGVLANTVCPGPHSPFAPFLHHLAELGWTEGRNLIIDCVLAPPDQLGQVAAFAAELVKRRPDVLLAGNTFAARALKQATGTIPIVANAGDSVREGLVTNLARPEANLTGVADFAVDLFGKRIGLLKEILPRLARVAIILRKGGDTPYTLNLLKDASTVAATLGFTSEAFYPEMPEDFDVIFARLTTEGFDAAHVPAGPLSYAYQAKIGELGKQYRVPTIGDFPVFAKNGFLLTYGIDLDRNLARLADYVDKILRGAKPADLPVEQPTKFQLVINLRTAKALGLTIPESFLLRADEVIE